MEKIFSNEIKSSLIKLGIYQIAGGIFGVFIFVYAIYNSTKITNLSIALYLIMLLFFAFSIFCGGLCIKGNKDALTYSLINQMLQFFSFAILGYAFKYIAGFYISVGIDLRNSLEFNLGSGISSFYININNQKERLEVDFNLVAVTLIYWIDRLKQKIRNEEIDKATASIGEI